FRAKASKARQAQSKLRLIEKKAESLEPLPGSSRRYPTFRFRSRRPSGRTVLDLKGIEKAFGENEVLHGVDLTVARGDRLAIMGPNGIGKSTLLRIAVGELEADEGSVTWGHETHPSYFAQDQHEGFEHPGWTAEEWITASCPGKTIGYVRGELGRVLFSGEDAEKRLGTLSGGEAARLVFCRIAIEEPNVMVLDEPTNHLDLESIEALVDGLKTYDGTLVFVSHDRWFVSRLADRIVEIRADGITDFAGSYEDYVHYCGDDHLDVDTVVLKARREKREPTGTAGAGRAGGRASRQGGDAAPRANRYRGRAVRQRRDRVTRRIEEAEARIEEIDGIFGDPGFYGRAEPERIRSLQEERERLVAETEELVAEWERLEEELEAI
ncbi:MAG: ATP-binding cassette domain-containing protein, partial [Gemmatimonadota bacterium]|nr:ATP-binding cassette domain-containing protein [Gemmatimonadota bacterium]